jgi:hypothetical protein
MTTSGNNDFERDVKASLEGFEVPYDSAHWAELEGKLDALPKANASFASIRAIKFSSFKWSFSMNVFAVIVACTTVFLLVFVVAGSHKASVDNPRQHAAEPVLRVSGPSSLAPPPVEHAVTLPSKSPEVDSVMASEELKAPDTVPAEPAQKEITSSNRLVAGASPSSSNQPVSQQALTPMPDLNAAHVRIYGDMLDPKRGFVYNTKEHLGEGPVATQTRVNVGWNDFVIYDPARHTTDSAETGASRKAEGNKELKEGKSERKSFFARKLKSKNNQPADTKTVPAAAASPKAKDSVMINPNLNAIPKFKEDRVNLDPY